MGKETEIDLNISDESDFSSIGGPYELSSIDKPEENFKGMLDARDYIPAIEDTGEQAATDPGEEPGMAAGKADEQETGISPEENELQAENIKSDPKTEILPADGDEPDGADSSTGNSEEDLSGGTPKPYDDDTLGDAVAEDTDAGVDASALEMKDPADISNIGNCDSATEPLPDGSLSHLVSKPNGNSPSDLTVDSIADDFVGRDDDEEAETDGASVISDANKRINKWALVNKISSIAVVVLIGAGFMFYLNPALIGLSKTQQPANPSTSEMPQAVAPVPQPLTVLSAPDKREQCQAKLAEAIDLRNQLLEKKSEIYQLDQFYRSGNNELEEKILKEIKRTGIATFQPAVQNKRIELILRTIQRRQAYIDELKKPAHWLNSGSEELYYLIRRAELDLQLTDIAGGIDLNRHLRHISAAMQKYRPGPDKLAIDPLKTELKPLEKIWEQVGQAKAVASRKVASPQDEIIANQICNGNYERVAELTRITASTASCLARMKGSDLFLNGVTSLSVDAAKRLFQWQGNWICLNSVKDLSEAAAQYLFTWKGNWISLNSLNTVPSGFAQHLLKWEGQQLELMGLEYNGTEAERKMLKYLALWETTGGKLFVSEKIRRELKQLM